MGKTLLAQDSLRMKTGAVYSVNIIEINDTHVKYRTYSNPDGPLYNVSKSTIDKYKLEGKTWERFYDLPVAKNADKKETDSKVSHYVAINLTDLIRTDITIFYEVMLNYKIGIRIPTTFGFRNAYFNPIASLSNPFAFRRNTVFKTGVDLRVYAGEGNGRARFVFGPAVYYMRLNRLMPDYVTTDKDFMIYKSSNSMRVLFLAGVVIRPGNSIQIGFDGGLGADFDFGEKAGFAYDLGRPIAPKAQLNAHIGYRF